MKHRGYLFGIGGLLSIVAVAVAGFNATGGISISSIIQRLNSNDLSNLSVTFSREKSSHNVVGNNYYYTSTTTSLGNTFYLRNASNQSLGNDYVAKMCGTFDKGSVEPEITFTTTNTGTNHFEFRKIKSISAVIEGNNTRTMTVSKSSDGTNWTSAGTLSVTSSGGTNTDVSGAKFIKLTYSGSYTANFTSFTIEYSCSPDDVELSSITLSGDYQTSFDVDDLFSHEGMTVTAHYTNSTSADVTSSATFSGYDMTSSGDQTVTVSYTEGGITKTATYGITVVGDEPQATLKDLLKSKVYTLTAVNGSTYYSVDMNFASLSLAINKWTTYDPTIVTYTQTFEFETPTESTITFNSVTEPTNSPMVTVLRLLDSSPGTATISSGSISSMSIVFKNASGTTSKSFTYTA